MRLEISRGGMSEREGAELSAGWSEMALRLGGKESGREERGRQLHRSDDLKQVI